MQPSFPAGPNQPMPQSYSSSQKHSSGGLGWMIAFIVTIIMLIAAIAFGVWAYTSRQDYKNNVDEKISAAVQVARQETATAKDAEFVQKEKEPLRQYSGPAAFGTVSIKYPKTWSVHVDETGEGATPLSGYMHPKYVPSLGDESSFAVRFEVTNQSYANELRQYENTIEDGSVKARPYKPVASPDLLATKLDGAVIQEKQGSMVLIPLRDKTLKVWTEAPAFLDDFNKTILPNLTFVP